MKKLYSIHFELPEEIANNIVDANCSVHNFKPIYPEEGELTEENFAQQKLNFIGLIVGKYLREQAESKIKSMQLAAVQAQIEAMFLNSQNLMAVRDVTVEDVE